MSDKFIGATSSAMAREAYIPVNEIPRAKQYIGQPPVKLEPPEPRPKFNVTLGANTSAIFSDDPRMLGINAARYKFVAKMFEGLFCVLEIGCMDGFGARIVAQTVPRVFATDFYLPHIEEARKHSPVGRIAFEATDFLDGTWTGQNFNGAYCLDVLEHIDPEQEPLFLQRVVECLEPNGVFICGMPTLESQRFASEANRKAHINCQSPNQITGTLRKYFANVFSFGMGDEVLNTAYEPLRQYQINLCTGPKK